MKFQYLSELEIRRIRTFERLGFAIHVFVFVLVNAGLYHLNHWAGPRDFYFNNVHVNYLQWHLFPLIGWGAGLALNLFIILFLSNSLLRWIDVQITHSVQLFSKTESEPSQMLLSWATKKAKEKLGYTIHLLFYIVMNGTLILVNYTGIGWQLSSDAELPLFQWFWFPLLAWGFGLAIHSVIYLFATALAGYREQPSLLPNNRAFEDIQGEYAEYVKCGRIAASRVGFFRHAIVFLSVNAVAYGTDYFLTKDLTFSPWITFSWIFFLIFHFVKVFLLHKDVMDIVKQHQTDRLMGNE